MYNDAAFRAQFPEFADTTAYPAATIQIFFNLASTFIAGDSCPWAMLQGAQLQAVLNYLTAHLMVLSNRQNAATNGGMAPGSTQSGYETAASIGDVSVSKLAPPVKDGWQFWLSSTDYGTALWALASLLAVGGLSIGGLGPSMSFRREGGVFL